MKYRVHTYQTIRVTYEVEAESAVEAKELVDKDGHLLFPADVCLEDPEWSDDFIVDPLLPNGEVDYDNVVTFFKEEEAA